MLPVSVEVIERRIYLIRAQKVMLDSDLAGLYHPRPWPLFPVTPLDGVTCTSRFTPRQPQGFPSRAAGSCAGDCDVVGNHISKVLEI